MTSFQVGGEIRLEIDRSIVIKFPDLWLPRKVSRGCIKLFFFDIIILDAI